MNEKSYLGRFFEPLIIVIIFLVILHTFFEEFAIFMEYPASIRRYLIIGSFCFDFIFTVEFFARLFISTKRGNPGRYFSREGGVIDLLSSIPLLILSSGPLLWSTFFGVEAGMLAFLGPFSFLKTFKIVRMVRALRFVRALKILGKIRPRYYITPRYVSRAVLIATAVIIVSLMGFNFLDQGKIISSRSIEVHKMLENYIKNEPQPDFNTLLNQTDQVLFISLEHRVVYESLDEKSFHTSFLDNDYISKRAGEYQIYYSIKDSQKTASFINTMCFSMIIGILFFFNTIYRKSITRHISEPLRVMIRGFKNAEYLTPVRINERNQDLETYRLGEQYNRKWLPVKKKLLELKKMKFKGMS